MKRIFLFTCLLFIATSYGARQNCWIFGPGVYGPVTSFSYNFYQSEDADYYSIGDVSLVCSKITMVSDPEYPAYGIASADFDGDNDADIVSAPYPGIYDYRAITVWENLDGSGDSWEDVYQIPASDVYSVNVCDLNGDSYTDILAGHLSYEGEDGIVWFSNNDGTLQSWTEHLISDSYKDVTRLEGSDIDNDGDVDVVACSYGDGQVTWFENFDGTGTDWEPHVIGTELTCVFDVVVCDINSDGKPDVVAAVDGQEKICWFENPPDPTGAWTERDVAESFVFRILPCDLNCDGFADIVAASSNGEILLWSNSDGSGESWEEVLIARVDYELGDIALGDFNSDGFEDIFGCGPQNSPVYWYKNLDETGTQWEPIEVHEHRSTNFCTVADINGDGESDVVSAGHYKFLHWWEISEEYSSQGFLESSVLDTESYPYYTWFSWSKSVPDGTSIGMQVRSSDDYSSMGEWSSELFESPVALDSVIGYGDRYFQYRANLSSTDISVTPLLHSVTVLWSLTGIELEEGNATAFSMVTNPVAGTATLEFSLPQPQNGSIYLYDSTGRLQKEFRDEHFIEGENLVSLGIFPPGVYFCRIDTGEGEECLRFVVID